MTPTSREPFLRTRATRFALVSIALLAALALASALLSAAALARGPQVRAVVGDAAAAVTQRDVTLTLRADQPLDPTSADGIAIEPSAPIQVDVLGASLRVRFTDTLAFATDYRLSVPALRGASTGATADTEYRFSTPPLEITTLERGGTFDRASEEDDAVVRHDLSHGTATTVFQAPRIQEYAEDGGDTVALTLDRDGATGLQHVGADGVSTALDLPGRGDVRLLRASEDAGRVGFVFTGVSDDSSQQYSGTLFLLDPADPSAPPRTVPGLDGAPVRAEAWSFVPGSAYLVAQTPDRSLLLVDATGAAPPRVLGQLGDLVSLLPGTTSVVVGSAAGRSVLDLTTGTLSPVPGTGSPQPGEGRVVLAPDTVASWSATRVSRTVGATSPETVVDAPAGERFEQVCASPSGRHLAVGVVSDAAALDGYPARADRVGRATDVIDAVTGEVVARVAGTLPDWCD